MKLSEVSHCASAVAIWSIWHLLWICEHCYYQSGSWDYHGAGEQRVRDNRKPTPVRLISPYCMDGSPGTALLWGSGTRWDMKLQSSVQSNQVVSPLSSDWKCTRQIFKGRAGVLWWEAATGRCISGLTLELEMSGLRQTQLYYTEYIKGLFFQI